MHFSEKRQHQADIANPVRRYLNTALFDLDSRLGRNVNLLGIVVIVVAVILSMIATLHGLSPKMKSFAEFTELAITIIFSLEYFLRAFAARKPIAYIFSFYGMIDLLTWAPLLLMGDATFAIRLLRLMRLLKLIRYLKALHLFLSSLKDTIEIMLVVAITVFIVVTISGNLIHIIEPETIPDAFIGSWWSLVTMTTVGYGDIVPVSTGGKIIASILMIVGITIFAMLTGTISVKIAQVVNRTHSCAECDSEFSDEYGYCPYCGVEQPVKTTRVCPKCDANLDSDDKYCSKCGAETSPETLPDP